MMFRCLGMLKYGKDVGNCTWLVLRDVLTRDFAWSCFEQNTSRGPRLKC